MNIVANAVSRDHLPSGGVSQACPDNDSYNEDAPSDRLDVHLLHGQNAERTSTEYENRVRNTRRSHD
jgi:hypothetical protein